MDHSVRVLLAGLHINAAGIARVSELAGSEEVGGCCFAVGAGRLLLVADALVKKHGLTNDPALVLLAKIVNGADTDNTLRYQPESAGLNAVAEGFRHLGSKDDHELNAAEGIVYDALYAYCQEDDAATEVGRGLVSS